MKTDSRRSYIRALDALASRLILLAMLLAFAGKFLVRRS